ncbi:MAG TPA: DUF3368 domain-containing protein [Candidatus Binatia bacterium]|jgi:hypothetical protein|nr:DUF3368 domain-containing protein [Candidatus Binatia bacterium]
MPATVVSNTSPLFYLHCLQQLEVLLHLFSQIMIPPAVVKELEEGQQRGLNVPNVSTYPWLQMKVPAELPSLPPSSHLGKGEVEAIALAHEIPETLLLLDDLSARRAAQGLGITVTGTLGVLLQAKEKGLVPALKPLLLLLRRAGFRLSSKVEETFLSLAGE